MTTHNEDLLNVAIAVCKQKASQGSWNQAVTEVVTDLLGQLRRTTLPPRLLVLLATPDWCDENRSLSASLLEQLTASGRNEIPLIGASVPRLFVSQPQENRPVRHRIVNGFAVLALSSENLWAHVGHIARPYELDADDPALRSSGKSADKRKVALSSLAKRLHDAREHHMGLGPSGSADLFGFLPGPFVDRDGERIFLDHQLYSELLKAFGDRYAFYGGSASNDLARPTVGYQFAGADCLSSSMVVCLMEFDFKMGAAMAHGLDVIPDHWVSVDELEPPAKASGYDISKLDGKPASERLRELMEQVKFSQPRPTLGLGASGFPHVVVPLEPPEQWQGSVRFTREIHLGYRLSVLNSTTDMLQERARETLELAIRQAGVKDPQNAKLIFAVACTGRFQRLEQEKTGAWWEAAEALTATVSGRIPVVLGLFAGEYAKDHRLRVRSDNFSIWISCLTGEATNRAQVAILQRKLIEAANVLSRCSTLKLVHEQTLALAEKMGATGGLISHCEPASAKILGSPHGYAHSKEGSGQSFEKAREMTVRDLPPPALCYQQDPRWNPWIIALESGRQTPQCVRLANAIDLLTIVVANRVAVFVPDSIRPEFHCDQKAIQDGNLSAQFVMPLVGSEGDVIGTLQIGFEKGARMDRDTMGLWVGYGQKVAAAMGRAMEYEERTTMERLSSLETDLSQAAPPDGPFPESDIQNFMARIQELIGVDYIHLRLKDEQVRNDRCYRLVVPRNTDFANRHVSSRSLIAKDEGSVRHAFEKLEIFTNTKHETEQTQDELRGALPADGKTPSGVHNELLHYQTVGNLRLLDSNGEVRGALLLHSKSEYFFTERMQRILRGARRKLDSLIDKRRAAFEVSRRSKTQLELTARGFLGALTIHQLKAPLSIIKAYAQPEATGGGDLDSYRKDCEIILRQARRMLDLLNARNIDVNPEFILLNPQVLLRAALGDLPLEARAHIGEATISPDLSAITVKTNSWLRVAIARLLENAQECAKNSNTNAAVQISRLPGSSNEIEIRIENGGPLMTQDDVEKMLLTGYSTKGDAHLGLGVPLAWVGIFLSGGKLVLAPRDDGGLVASVQLPLRETERNKEDK